MSSYDHLLNGLWGKTAKGQCFVDVKIGEKVRTKLPLIVVNKKASKLLSLDWSESFGSTSRGIPNNQYHARPELLYSNVVKEPKTFVSTTEIR